MTQIIELSNQQVTTTSPLVITRSIITQARDLAQEHELFHEQYIIGGRKALYSMLAKVYGLVLQFEASPDKLDLGSLMRQELFEKYGIRTQDNTSDIAIIVRYITRADRKTTHVYSRAIETARANQISTEQFANYLEQAGGVERIRAISVDGFVEKEGTSNKAEKLELMRKYLIARREFPLTTFKVSSSKDFGFNVGNNFNLTLCSQKDGRFYALANVPLDTELEKKIMDLLVNNLTVDVTNLEKNVERFYGKAMQKREQNSMKQLIRHRPEVAKGMLRIRRIRSLSKSHSSH